MGAAEESRIVGFPPVITAACRVLICGSMPSVASLSQQHYYDHPQNAFWKIMGDLYAAGRDMPYAERCHQLCECGIGIWDVIGTCVRPGSMDAAIAEESVGVNDIAGLCRDHPGITAIGLNGGTAARYFKKYQQAHMPPHVHMTQLPSTSPAYAAMRYPDKLQRWRDFFCCCWRLLIWLRCVRDVVAAR